MENICYETSVKEKHETKCSGMMERDKKIAALEKEKVEWKLREKILESKIGDFMDEGNHMKCGHLQANLQPCDEGPEICIVCNQVEVIRSELNKDLSALEKSRDIITGYRDELIKTLAARDAKIAELEQTIQANLVLAQDQDKNITDYEKEVADLEARIAEAHRIMKLDKELQDFSCPHDADDLCKCAETERQMYRNFIESRNDFLTSSPSDLVERLKRVEDAFKKYATHQWGCPADGTYEIKKSFENLGLCKCGFMEAL